MSRSGEVRGDCLQDLQVSGEMWQFVGEVPLNWEGLSAGERRGTTKGATPPGSQ